jgi:hypothetical protein
MKKAIAIYALLLLVFALTGLSYSEILDPAALVDSFQAATDIQKDGILADNIGKEIAGSGTVSNAGEYDFFDTVNDIRGIYFQATTQLQKTKNNTPYQVIFLFRDRAAIENLNKGQTIQKAGKLIRILDERLQISVWIFCGGELTDRDKSLFKQTTEPAY